MVTRACPPEDYGATGAYLALVEPVGDSGREQHADYVEWAGVFDPEFFDLAITNTALQRVR